MRREALAEYAHEAWASSMRRFFENCGGKPHEDGGIWVDGEHVRALKELMETPYSELPEEQKDKDRAEADKILKQIGEEVTL